MLSRMSKTFVRGIAVSRLLKKLTYNGVILILKRIRSHIFFLFLSSHTYSWNPQKAQWLKLLWVPLSWYNNDLPWIATSVFWAMLQTQGLIEVVTKLFLHRKQLDFNLQSVSTKYFISSKNSTAELQFILVQKFSGAFCINKFKYCKLKTTGMFLNTLFLGQQGVLLNLIFWVRFNAV